MPKSFIYRLVSDEIAVVELIPPGDTIDLWNYSELRELIIELAASGHTTTVLDVTRAEFLDSTGLGEILRSLKRLREQGGSLTLVIAGKRLLKTFLITRTTGLFNIFKSPDAAIEFLRTGGPLPFLSADRFDTPTTRTLARTGSAGASTLRKRARES